MRRSTVSTSLTAREPFGGQQHVVVLGNGAGHQRGAAALHGDVRPGVAAHPQHLGDLSAEPGRTSALAWPAIAAGVVDAAAGQHVGVGDDVARSDDTPGLQAACMLAVIAPHAVWFSSSCRSARAGLAVHPSAAIEATPSSAATASIACCAMLRSTWPSAVKYGPT